MIFLGEILVVFGFFGVFGEILLVHGVFVGFVFLFEKSGIGSSMNFGGFVFVKFCAAGESVGFGVIGSFLMLGFGKLGRELDGLLVAQIVFGSNGFGRRGRFGGR